ncbi:MAG: PAS domain-containing protein [Chloroflexaceae bacterium]|nr:PAS domain-containing protein [Chloroflexaceae bacterium]
MNTTQQQITTLQAELAAAKQQIADLEMINDLYVKAIDSSNIGLWDWDIVTHEVYFSDVYKTMLGYQPEELANSFETWRMLIHPDDLELVTAQFQAYLAAEIPVYEIEHRLKAKDGSWRWIIARAEITDRAADGKPTRMSGTHTDNTTQHLAQDQLRRLNTDLESLNLERSLALQRSTNLLQMMLTHMPILIYELDQDGTILFADGRALHTMGVNPTEVTGRSILDLLGDENTITYEHHVAALQGNEQHFMTQLGAVTMETWLTPVRDDFDVVRRVIGVAIDVSERAKAEEEHLLLTEQIIQMQRAAIRELSTPLIPIVAGVVIMPLIGAIDTRRATAVLETLLEGVAQHNAHAAILDITGVQTVDTQVANALIQAAQAVRLLGAQVILTGIQPQIAHTLVTLGVNLGGIITRSTLQEGIAYAVRMRRDQASAA